MSDMNVPAYTLALQQDATHPGRSGWVEANAGSGKTHVLTGRLIRLMLAGARPDTLVCLTFTETAAAEMANRVFERLSVWTVCPETELKQALISILGRTPEAGEVLSARCLFAQALESPGGLKIQTVHSFAERILHQFSLEAGVWPDFSVLDNSEAQALKNQAIETVIGTDDYPEKASSPSPLKYLQRHMSAASIRKHLMDLLEKRQAFEAMVNAKGGLIGVDKALVQALGIDPLINDDDFNQMIVHSPILPPHDWGQLADALLSVTDKKDTQKRGQALKTAFKALDTPFIVDRYLDVFCKQDNKGNKTLYNRSRFVSKDFLKTCPAWHKRLMDEYDRLEDLLTRQKARAQYDITRAFHHWGGQVIALYQALKAGRHGLDFSDLIEKTAQLLKDQGAAWVHYKLDMGIDHILVDEAQDTSPEQWMIINRLSAEFYAGEGARNRHRTFFAVGDKKQSIYRFQGVDPDLFQDQWRYYNQSSQRAGLDFATTPLTLSFRSWPKIMALIMKVFADEALATAIGGVKGLPEHAALPDKRGGRVMLWPLIYGTKNKTKPDLWAAEPEHHKTVPPHVELAEAIAHHLKARLTAGDKLPSGERLTPKDCLILVRKRSPLFWAIIQALKRAEIPLAGADRLILTSHLAVQDLLALGKAVLTPSDDLNLAALLKSPLFNLSETGLFELAHNRKGRLIDALIDKAKSDDTLKAIYQRFKQWQALARHLSAFGFYHHILGVDGGLKSLYSRFGYEAEDAIMAFIDQVTEAETKGISQLRAFIAFCEHEAREIKRQISRERDEVRVMTIHGAKGLESPLVMLVDTVDVPDGKHVPKWLHLDEHEGAPLVWSLGAYESHEGLKRAREAHLNAEWQEYFRLLYVALTRAAQEVIVAGALSARKSQPHENSWYRVVEKALETELSTQHLFGQSMRLWHHETDKTSHEKTDANTPHQNKTETKNTDLPKWLSSAPKPLPPPVSITPSKTNSNIAAYGENSEDTESDLINLTETESRDSQDARKRGLAIHTLIERWCGIDDTHKLSALPNLISAIPDIVNEQDTLYDKLARLWHNPDYSWLFKTDGLNEVECRGLFTDKQGRTVHISGIIDRLVIHQSTLWIIDFKTGRKHENPAYQQQLARYRQVFAKTGHSPDVTLALFWIDHEAVEIIDTEKARYWLDRDGLTPLF